MVTRQSQVHAEPGIHRIVSRSELILDEAEDVWLSSKKEYRDACIVVGGLLADFVLARLREADGLPEAQRISQNLTRERSMEDAAERLKMNTHKAHELVRVAKVVELFGPPGELSYTSIRVFTVFVQRVKCAVARGRSTKDDEVTPSESETWEIKETAGRAPADIYRQAVEEGWDSLRTREECKSVEVGRRGGRRPGYGRNAQDHDDRERIDPHSNRGHSEIPSLRSIGLTADPRDLVDMLLEVIMACPRSDELKRLLLERIR